MLAGYSATRQGSRRCKAQGSGAGGTSLPGIRAGRFSAGRGLQAVPEEQAPGGRPTLLTAGAGPVAIRRKQGAPRGVRSALSPSSGVRGVARTRTPAIFQEGYAPGPGSHVAQGWGLCGKMRELYLGWNY